MKKVLLTFAVFLWMTLDSKACVCGNYEYEEKFKFATHVFIGEAVHNVGPDPTETKKWDEEGYGSTVKFQIDHVLKGEIKTKYVIIDQRALGDCSIGYEFGRKYLIFARDSPIYPTTVSMRGNDYINADSLFEDSYDLEKALQRFDDYFNRLKKDNQFMYSDYCSSYNQDSKFYKKAIKTVGNPKN